MEIKHFSHDHQLTLEFQRQDRPTCVACSQPCVDLVYTCKECDNYHIHKHCAELPERISNHPFHPFHPLVLTFRLGGNYACCGCGKWDRALLYYCEACNFTLSPDCALKPSTRYEFVGWMKIRHFLHKHDLELQVPELLEDGTSWNDLCSACEKQCSPDDSYYCRQCPEFRLHKTCAEQMPRAIMHPRHKAHPMILRAKDSFFNRECVACARTDNALTYRCSMCRFEMDPKCVLAKPGHLI